MKRLHYNPTNQQCRTNLYSTAANCCRLFICKWGTHQIPRISRKTTLRSILNLPNILTKETLKSLESSRKHATNKHTYDKLLITYFLRCSGGSLISFCIRTLTKSAGLPTSPPAKPPSPAKNEDIKNPIDLP